MKTKILIIMILIGSSVLFASDYSEYEMDLVKSFKEHSGKIDLDFDFGIDAPQGPTSIAFRHDGKMLISDPIKKRLIVLDKDLNYEAEHKDLFSSFTLDMETDKNNNIITSVRYYYSMDTSDYKKKLEIKMDNDYTSSNHFYDFIYHKNTVFAYLEDGSLISIEDPGVSFQENNNKIIATETTLKNIKTKFKDFIELTETNHLLINGELRTRDYKRYSKYWNDYYNGDRQKLTLTGKLFYPKQMEYLGKDSDKNVYWQFSLNKIVVINNKGQFIKNFIFDYTKKRMRPAIHPSGDIYFMNYNEDGAFIYRIKRQW